METTNFQDNNEKIQAVPDVEKLAEKPNNSKFSKAIILLVLLLGIIGFFAYRNLQKMPDESSQIETIPEQKQIEAEEDMMQEEVVDISEDISTPKITPLTPEEIFPEDNLKSIEVNNNKYSVYISPGGLCPWEDDGSGCTYTDEPYLTGILRLWEDDARGIFALNFQSITFESYYIDHFEVFKEGDSETFSEQEISFWKNWLEELLNAK